MNDRTGPASSPTARPVDVIVVGAGISGLLASRYAHRHGVRALVIDPHPVGGRARSDPLGGAVVNRGPHALYLGGPLAVALGELGVATGGAPPPLRGGMARRDGHLHRLPTGAFALARTSLLRGGDKVAFARAMASIGRMTPTRIEALASVTTAEWLDGFRLPQAARAALAMLVRTATYCDAFDVLSADVAAGQTRLVLRNGVRYLDGGWQRAVDALATGVDVLASEVTAVRGDADGVTVELADGSSRRARASVIAVNSPATAARLLGRDAWPVGEPAFVASLDLVHEARDVHDVAPHVVFDVDEPRYFAPHGPPADLAPVGLAVSHAARYVRSVATDRLAPAACRGDLEALAAEAGLAPGAVVASRYLHRVTAVSALAVAPLGGLAGRPRHSDTEVPGVFVAGDWVGPVGHLADACAASARSAAHAAAGWATTRSVVPAGG